MWTVLALGNFYLPTTCLMLDGVKILDRRIVRSTCCNVYLQYFTTIIIYAPQATVESLACHSFALIDHAESKTGELLLPP
jgi:hypothetical protein